MSCDFNPRWFWTKKNIDDVLTQLFRCDEPIYHICSGISNIGDIRLDRSYIKLPLDHKHRVDYQGSCNIIGDMTHLPFKSGVAGTVLCDPPYKFKFLENPLLIKELVRICKPAGKIIFIAPWVPNDSIIKVIRTDLWKVGKNRPYFKIMSLFSKVNGQLGDYEKRGVSKS